MNTDLSKKPLRVGLRLMNNNMLDMREYVKLNGKKEKQGYGFMQDIWDHIEHLGNFKDVKVDYINYSVPMKDLIDKIHKGEYDFIIGNFSVTEEREKKVIFTRPLYVNLMSVLYLPNESSLRKFSKVVVKTLVYPLLLLIVIGLVSGVILYAIDKQRGRRRAILSSLASMFGEMGFLHERSNMNVSGMAIAFFIMLISYYFAIYLQAVTVGEITDAKEVGEISGETIKNKRLLAEEGHPYAPLFAEKGAKIFYKKNMNKEQLTNYYMKNKDNYDGVIMDYWTAKYYQGIDENFLISANTLGYDEISIPVNPQREDLEEKLNSIIELMRKNGQMVDACSQYFGDSDKYLCIV